MHFSLLLGLPLSLHFPLQHSPSAAHCSPIFAKEQSTGGAVGFGVWTGVGRRVGEAVNAGGSVRHSQVAGGGSVVGWDVG